MRIASVLLAIPWLAVSVPTGEVPRLSLEQASSRKPGDFSPVFLGRTVTVAGTTTSQPFHFVGYTILTIVDERGGMAVRVSENDRRLDAFEPGTELEVTGSIDTHAGMPVIVPSHMVAEGRRPAPAPAAVQLVDLQGFRHLGRLVQTEGQAVETGDTTAGAYLLIQSGHSGLYKIFLPHSPGKASGDLSSFRAGDRVRVTGVAFQYCPRPPYSRWFEVLIHDSASIVVVERGWPLPPIAMLGGVAALFGIGYVIYRRGRRLRTQRERLRRIYHLGEEVLGAGSPEAILKRVGDALPSILGVSRVRLYVHNRGAQTLEGIGADAVSIPLASPPGGIHAGAAACFHYRSLLTIPDIARSPFPVAAAGGERQPKSLLFVPMQAQGEVAGVLELDQDDRARDFTVDEQSLSQHLGNQIGVAIRLLDQRSVREQLFRTEKLAAVGRLITGVVNELQDPLASIAELAEMAQNKPHFCPAEREIRAITSEARKASSIMERLVSFASEPVETRPVDVNGLLRRLMEFREQDWKASGIRVRDLTTRDGLSVMGSQGQLEQVFLNLLVHAEQSVAATPEKSITIRTSLLAKRILVEIGFSAAHAAAPDDTAAGVLVVARSVIAGHGGEVRLVCGSGGDARFEMELPWVARERPAGQPARAAVDSSRQVTALVIEPEEAAQRQLLAMLSGRGYRVVPVNNSDTGLELAQRMRFDIALCSVHSPGLNWVELSERLQSRVGAFVLLSDGYDAELAADFEGERRSVLAKPVAEAELDRVLGMVESGGAALRARTA